MKFDRNLSAIHAYLCADGYVIKNPEHQKHKYYYIGLRNRNKILLKDFQNRFSQVFCIKPIMYKDGRCKLQSKEIFHKLTQEYSYYSDKWTLPKLSKENLRIWLRTFFDCEAWLELDARKNRRISLDSINYSGLAEIQKALSVFNINSVIKERNKRKIFRLHIFGKENIIKFQKEIGFLHPIKKKRLEDVIKSYVNYEWRFPKEKIKLFSFIISLMGERVKIKKPCIIRITSIIKGNLVNLSNILFELYKIESKSYERKNIYGTIYYELVIQKKDSIKKILENNLLDEKNRNKIELAKL